LRQPAAGPGGRGPLLRQGDDEHGPGRRAVCREHARRQPRPSPLPGRTRVLRESGEFAGSAAADVIRDNQQWVLGMLNAEAAWSVTRGSGVTVAVIDSGVNPYVSDLAGSVITGPDYTGVHTSPNNPNWGLHGA